MEYWQIAAGSEGRDYSRYFLRYGIAFAGGEEKIAALEQVRVGDVLVLKRGLYEIAAAGTVVARNGAFRGNGDKDWLYDFDGWSLEAWCYVDWHVPQNSVSTGRINKDYDSTPSTIQTSRHCQ